MREVAVADVERVQERLVMEKRGVVDIERDFAHDREGLVAFFVIEDAHVARDQAAEWIEREPADGSFHAAFVQFLDDRDFANCG